MNNNFMRDKRIKKFLMILLVAVLFSATTIITFKATTIKVEAATKAGWHWANAQKTTLCYYKNNKKLIGWQNIGKDVFFFSGESKTYGQIKTGWQKFTYGYFYLQASGVVGTKGKILKGWQTINKRRYYLTPSGKPGTVGKMYYGLKTIDKNKYYFGSSTDGSRKYEWQEINKKWYYLGNDGIMRTGFQSIGGKTYYFGGAKDGNMRKNGWYKQTVNKVDKHYYLGSNGAACTGLLKLTKNKQKNIYVMDKNGVRLTGWQKANQKWYYLNSRGLAQKGWLDLDKKKYKKRYYLNNNCEMLHGIQIIGSNKYYFGGANDGQMKLGWQTVSGNKYFMNAQGIAQKGWIQGTGTSKGKYYYLNTNGVMLKNVWLALKAGKYYLGSDGARYTGLKQINSKSEYYYWNTNGILQYNQWQVVLNNTYYINGSGYATKGWKKLSRQGFYENKSRWQYFNSTGILTVTSDLQGCSHGNATIKNAKNLNTPKNLSYGVLSSASNWEAVIDNAAKDWRTTGVAMKKVNTADGKFDEADRDVIRQSDFSQYTDEQLNTEYISYINDGDAKIELGKISTFYLQTNGDAPYSRVEGKYGEVVEVEGTGMVNANAEDDLDIEDDLDKESVKEDETLINSTEDVFMPAPSITPKVSVALQISITDTPEQ